MLWGGCSTLRRVHTAPMGKHHITKKGNYSQFARACGALMQSRQLHMNMLEHDIYPLSKLRTLCQHSPVSALPYSPPSLLRYAIDAVPVPERRVTPGSSALRWSFGTSRCSTTCRWAAILSFESCRQGSSLRLLTSLEVDASPLSAVAAPRRWTLHPRPRVRPGLQQLNSLFERSLRRRQQWRSGPLPAAIPNTASTPARITNDSV